MAGQLVLSGSIVAGPPGGSDTLFPGSQVNIALSLAATPKSFDVASGAIQRNIPAGATYVDLDVAGPNTATTKGEFLYLRSDAPADVRLTTDDGAGGTVVSSFPIKGTLVIELDPAKFLKLLEARAADGARLEFFVCGQE